MFQMNSSFRRSVLNVTPDAAGVVRLSTFSQIFFTSVTDSNESAQPRDHIFTSSFFARPTQPQEPTLQRVVQTKHVVFAENDPRSARHRRCRRHLRSVDVTLRLVARLQQHVRVHDLEHAVLVANKFTRKYDVRSFTSFCRPNSEKKEKGETWRYWRTAAKEKIRSGKGK